MKQDSSLTYIDRAAIQSTVNRLRREEFRRVAELIATAASRAAAHVMGWLRQRASRKPKKSDLKYN